jgi:hypothetical protein
MRRFLALVRSFSCEKSGAIALEFALVCCLYFIPLVAIIFQSIFAYHQANRLDRGVQILAAKIRNGTILLTDLTETYMRDSLCVQVTPVLTCSSLKPRLYVTPECQTETSCWTGFYTNFNKAVRKTETYVARLPTTYSGAQQRQVLIVYYPLPMLSKLWDTRTTETVDGVKYHGIYSAAIWMNDPSVGVF